MNHEPQPDRPTAGPPPPSDEPAHSVLELVARRLGEAPRVTLRDEESANVSSPVIDPSSQEKTAVPRGRTNYQFLGEIARGGMGVILKGHDTDLGRDVAVKVLDGELAKNPAVVQRFVEEAQIGGQLQHPGIVPVYEIGTMKDERPFFTMKLVKGRTLATLLSERESPAADRRRLVDIFEAVCQTMAYAHSRGVIHRDLKPANIMVGAFGEVQVVDWGLAKVLARGGTADEKRARVAHSQLTVLETVRSREGSGSGSDSMVGSVMGTPAYMPPEQAAGHVDRLDERSDVFALGAILCEILTGLPPYVGSRDEIVAAAAQAERDPALKRLAESGADPELVKLTTQCLMPAAAARPANAGVLAERVHQYVVSVEERAQAARVESAAALLRVEQERKARRLVVALGAAVVAVLLVAGGSWAYVQKERADRDREQAAQLQAAAERDARLTVEIGDALSEAAVHEGGGRWDEALLSAERARALAQGGGAGSDLMARVDGAVARLAAGRGEAQARAERDADNRRLLAELLEAREPDWDRSRGDDPKQVAADYEDVFRRHGIDIDAGTPQDVAAGLQERGLGSEIALFLDSLTALRRETGDVDGTVRALDVAHAVDPDPLRADLREAVAARALDVLRGIVASGYEDQPPITIELLGSALEELDRRDEAWQVYRTGIGRFPGDFSLQYRLGRLLTPPELSNGNQEELQEAAQCYSAALAQRPDSTTVRYYLGRVLFKLGQPARAIEQFREGQRLRPDDGTFDFHIALCRFDLGEVEAAEAGFRELVDRRDPPWLAGWAPYMLGRVLESRGRGQEALESYRRAAASDTGTVFRNGLRAAILTFGSAEEREALIDETLARSQDDAGELNNLAWALVTRDGASVHDLDLAARFASRSVELRDDDAAWNTLGVALYYAGDLQGAVDALRNSVRLQGDGNVVDWLFLAMANLRLGDTGEAHAWYDKAVDWMARQTGSNPDTTRFRAEADALFSR